MMGAVEEEEGKIIDKPKFKAKVKKREENLKINCSSSFGRLFSRTRDVNRVRAGKQVVVVVQDGILLLLVRLANSGRK